MLVYCPSCDKSVNIGSQSRYDVFICNCGRRFRGIYAKVNELHRWALGWWIPSSDQSIWPENKGQTPCPFCSEWVDSRITGYWPEVCRCCTRSLPIEEVK
jgi:hypothetical protein